MSIHVVIAPVRSRTEIGRLVGLRDTAREGDALLEFEEVGQQARSDARRIRMDDWAMRNPSDS